uniref:Uncharacterized protein n=2 Tax=Picea TaxID=3328 RepID=A0A101M3P2_PICGL|nr:hypothetical protein ABT39_MTgene133 [Picea glauca]KUM50307.1 hypothetical protein ABT39_MTgene150 [Picea glauca]KUM50314.1 hypothetical protein ABT39_MTgene157 [Picea glauca]QHR91778.1 hypothetical protein Q903MT_gene5814 [Picea sitchensis]
MLLFNPDHTPSSLESLAILPSHMLGWVVDSTSASSGGTNARYEISTAAINMVLSTFNTGPPQ